ncbi:hypothetical protein [Flavobacterium marginilacus]|uniref:hypothetical protein n=1 Tax=Flavobacterium marginilacus TaxID=3003256 RepID=UPI00248DBD3C|nr:hypothetical protein [Flavobacterium marginilacus]
MKNLFLSAAIALGSLTSFASTTAPVIIVKTISIGDEYTEIKLEELPTAVTDAFKKAYPADAVITKAYKNEKKEYKLDITAGGKTETLFANEDGTWIKK